MSLVFRDRAAGTGQPWPVLALLLLAVLLPTLGLLWSMNRAWQSEEAAVRLRLAEAYQSQLQSAALRLQDHGRLRAEALSREEASRPPAERFAALVAAGDYDAVLILAGSGQVAYPPLTNPVDAAARDDDEWTRARRAEFETKDWREAALRYERIARARGDVHRGAQAWQAYARSRLKAGDVARALEVLTVTLTAPRYRAARDEQGRWIVPNALLLALETTADRGSPRFRRVADELEHRLVDYSAPIMPASQRRFVWRQLKALDPSRPDPPLLAAGELAHEVLGRGIPPRDRGLVPSGVAGVWALPSSDGRVIALFREARLTHALAAPLEGHASATVRWELHPPRPTEPADAARGRTMLLAEPLRDWRLSLHPLGPDLFSAAARPGRALRAWTSLLVLAAVGTLTFAAGQRVRRQMQSTRLKDDLLAIVSHELKTPLSSMRVLVDTLLDDAVQDPARQREYLEIIARENQRLSGLIEDFLTFSRMERGRHVFEFGRVSLADVVERAAASAGDRLRAPGCRFETMLEAGLPPVRGDRDALVTVVLNLVDNALKYTGPDKHIVVRTYRRAAGVCVEVEDNGIGFTRRVARRIFERFFQADRDAAGSAAGVGLGLSIVKSIVTAHDGRIDVVSQPGKGSRFTVCLPSAS